MLSLVLCPFYVFKSGLPQPADAIALLVLPLLVRRGFPTLPESLRRPLIALGIFVGHVVVVNLVWGLLLIDYDVRKVGALGFAAFYLFNGYMVFVSVLLFAKHGPRFLTATVWATAVGVWVQVALFMVRGGSTGFRESLFFNNPNQLGYYALIAASLIAFGFQRGRLPSGLAAASLASCALFSALSLSKAAMLGTVIVAAVATLRRPILLVLTCGIVLLGAQLRDPTDLIDRIEYRISDMGDQGDDNLEGRGYSRIERHPQYLVLGAGEVGHDRHGDFGGELHSSWATVLFSYGVVGLGLLLHFLFRALRLVRPMDLLFLAPVAFFGLTHNGLRFRLFWVFLGFVFVTTYYVRLDATRRASRARLAQQPSRRSLA